MCLKQHLRPTGYTQGTQSCQGLLSIVRCSMRLYLHKRQQPSVAGLLSFLDVSSLNSAAPCGAALFLTYAGRARGAPLSHGSQNGVNRKYGFVPYSSGHLAVAMGSVS